MLSFAIVATLLADWGRDLAQGQRDFMDGLLTNPRGGEGAAWWATCKPNQIP